MATRRQTALSGLGSGWVGVDERRRPVMVTTGDASVGSPSQTRRWRPPRTRRKMGATRHEKVKTVIRVFSTGGSVIYRSRVLLPQNAPRNEAWIQDQRASRGRRAEEALQAGFCRGRGVWWVCLFCLPAERAHSRHCPSCPTEAAATVACSLPRSAAWPFWSVFGQAPASAACNKPSTSLTVDVNTTGPSPAPTHPASP